MAAACAGFGVAGWGQAENQGWLLLMPGFGQQISDLEHKEAKSNQPLQQENKRIQDSISSLLDNFVYTNICIMGVLEREESKKLETYLKK